MERLSELFIIFKHLEMVCEIIKHGVVDLDRLVVCINLFLLITVSVFSTKLPGELWEHIHK